MPELIYTQDAIVDLRTKFGCCFADLMIKVLNTERYGISECMTLNEALYVQRVKEIVEGYTKDNAIIGYTSDATATIDISSLDVGEFTDDMFIQVTADYAGPVLLAEFFYDGDGDANLNGIRDELIAQINAGGSGYTAGTPVGDTFVITVPTNLSALPTGTDITITFAPYFYLKGVLQLSSVRGQTPTTWEKGWQQLGFAITDRVYVEGATGSTSGFLYVPRPYSPITNMGPVTHDFNGGVDFQVGYESDDGATGIIGGNTGNGQTQTITLPVDTYDSALFVNNTPVAFSYVSGGGDVHQVLGIISDNTNINAVTPQVDVFIYETRFNYGLGTIIPLATGSQSWNMVPFWNSANLNRISPAGIVEIYDVDCTGATTTFSLDTELIIPELRGPSFLYYDKADEKIYIGSYSPAFRNQASVAYIDLAINPVAAAGPSLRSDSFTSYNERIVGSGTGTSFAAISNSNSTKIQVTGIAGDFIDGGDSTVSHSLAGNARYTHDPVNNVVYTAPWNSPYIVKLEGFSNGTPGSSSTYTTSFVFQPNDFLYQSNGTYFGSLYYRPSENCLWVIENRDPTGDPSDRFRVLCRYDLGAGSSVQIANSKTEYPMPGTYPGVIPDGGAARIAGDKYLVIATTAAQAFFDIDSRTWVYGTVPANSISPSINNIHTPAAWTGYALGDDAYNYATDEIIVSSTGQAAGVERMSTLQAYALTNNSGDISATFSGTVTPIYFDGTNNCLTEQQVASLIEIANKYCCECSNC